MRIEESSFSAISHYVGIFSKMYGWGGNPPPKITVLAQNRQKKLKWLYSLVGGSNRPENSFF